MYLCAAMRPTTRSTISRSGFLRRALIAIASFTAMLVLAGPALAAGNFVVKTSTVDEKGGEWHIKVRIDLSRAPNMMHTPMRFTFSKEAVDERAIMSKGAEPEHHRMVIDTPPKQIVSMDVDFADASGKVFRSTYFEFDLQRASGYFEAGEYLVTLSGPDGEVGGSQRLVLKGDNPPVYRGALVFDTNKSTKQKGPHIEEVSSGLDGGPAPGDTNNDTSTTSATGEVAAVGSAAPMVPSSAYNRTPEEEAVQGHPSGCGCSVLGAAPTTLSLPAAALLALGWIARRRRK
jgi:MYXO-CTERM domain-containing protein